MTPLTVTARDLALDEPIPTNLQGWVHLDTWTVKLVATARDGESAKGVYDEWLKGVECTGDGVSGGVPDNGSLRPGETVFWVPIQGPTGPAGVQFVCTATFLRTYPTDCTIVFGVEICIPPRQDPDEVTAVYANTIRLDGTPPTVTNTTTVQPNAAGWYREAGFVSFSGTDPQSGIASCSVTQAFGGLSSTAVQVVPGGCINVAGLTGSGHFTYRYDDVAPSLAPTVSPRVIPLNGSATASANASDAHSGVKSQGCDPVDTSTPGVHTVACSATDRADNTATSTATYTVAYSFSGFSQPVDASARNVAKAGRTIPLKWRVTDGAGAPVTDLTNVSVTTTALSCSLGTTEDAIEEYASGNSGLQNHGDGYYQFNWSTPKSYAKSCKTLRLDLGDGIARTATFEFEK